LTYTFTNPQNRSEIIARGELFGIPLEKGTGTTRGHVHPPDWRGGCQ
jgi:hypothetical protein